MDIKLSVKYFSQLDNDPSLFGSGARQCNLTSTAMALNFITKGDLEKRSKANGYCEPESFYGSKLYKYGDTTDHTAHTACLKKEFGIDSQWRTNLSTKDLERQLQKDLPIPIGVKYKGSGHIILVVGINSQGFLVHDPYGERLGSQDAYNVGVGGSFDLYSFATLNELWLDSPSSPNSGWGRIFN